MKLSFWFVLSLLVKISLIIVLLGIVLLSSLIIYFHILAALVKEEKITDPALLAIKEGIRQHLSNVDIPLIRAVLTSVYKYKDDNKDDNYLVIYDFYHWFGWGKGYEVMRSDFSLDLSAAGGGFISYRDLVQFIREIEDYKHLQSTKDQLNNKYGQPELVYQRSEVKP